MCDISIDLITLCVCTNFNCYLCTRELILYVLLRCNYSVICHLYIQIYRNLTKVAVIILVMIV